MSDLARAVSEPSQLETVAAERMRRWRARPVAFVRECLRAEPEPWQVDLLEGAQRGPRACVVGSKGCGKTAVLAWLLLWWLATRPESNIAATSISADNLRDGLWKEAALWLQRSPILASSFVWSATRIASKTHPATWWASARAWAKSADAQRQSDTLAGLHARYMLFLIDEAGSIPRSVAVTAEAALASGKECKLILSGNPTSPDGPLYAAAVTHKHQWAVVHINGDPADPRRSQRVDAKWAQDQIDAYGGDNPWVLVNVFGRFPPAAFNALLGVEEVEAAMRRQLRPEAYTWAQKRLGVDVARFGDDRTVLFPRQGLRAWRPKVLRHTRGASVSTEIATAVMRAKTTWGSELEFIDATGGWAAGARDVLLTAGIVVNELNFGGKALDPRYENERAALWIGMSEWIKRGGQLPNVPEIVGELVTPTYTFSQRGKFLVEPKDLVKARLGRSPDLADGLATTFGLPEMPADVVMQQRYGVGRPGRVKFDFDPFAEVKARS